MVIRPSDSSLFVRGGMHTSSGVGALDQCPANRQCEDLPTLHLVPTRDDDARCQIVLVLVALQTRGFGLACSARHATAGGDPTGAAYHLLEEPGSRAHLGRTSIFHPAIKTRSRTHHSQSENKSRTIQMHGIARPGEALLSS